MGCYCTTVYYRLTPLAGCAVLTYRHILTTASSTELILKDHRSEGSLTNILGAWYDYDADTWNSSLYMAPARIHYHPRCIRNETVNASHPIVGYFDLAVWASTYALYGSPDSLGKACICTRGGSHPRSYAASTPKGELLFIVGFQYIINFKKVPMPWFKYAVRTKAIHKVCPKTEWGWYHCVPGDWAPLGIESGAALHVCFEGRSWRYDGLIGLNVFSMRLRSNAIIHYFHPLDSHPVLDFLYSAYMGRLKYEFLDHRFKNTQWHAPRPKSGKKIKWNYRLPGFREHFYIPFNY